MYQKALALLEQTGCQIGLVRARLKYAEFLEGQGKTDDASELLQKAREQATQIRVYLP